MNITSGLVQPAQSAAALEAFSFHETPVLVIENFWSVEERGQFREAMERAHWKRLEESSSLRQDFPNSGNWAKADIAPSQADVAEPIAVARSLCTSNPFPNRPAHWASYILWRGDCLLTQIDGSRPSQAGPVPFEAGARYLIP